MMCLKDILLYIVLLPVPSASPLFIVLYWLAVFLSIRPCSYCIALFFVVYLATSPSSPFLDVKSPQLPLDPKRPLTSPAPDRTWLTWNEGRWWDPAIMGYREIATLYQPLNTTETITGAAVGDEEAKEWHIDSQPSPAEGQRDPRTETWWRRSLWRRPTTPGKPVTTISAHPVSSTIASAVLAEVDLARPARELAPLPANHIDLRWHGLGFILDFGFTRTEEGLSWEIADHKRALAGLGSLEQQGQDADRAEDLLKDTNLHTESETPGVGTAADWASRQWQDWKRISFAGAW